MAHKNTGGPLAPDAIKSGNVANIFLQVMLTIEKLGETTKDVRQYLDPIFSLAQVCVVLADSAESVAESTGNPELRNATFDFVAKIRKEVQSLCKFYREIQVGAFDSTTIEKVKTTVHRVKELTRETRASPSQADSSLRRRILDEGKTAANFARSLLVAAPAAFDSFWPSVQSFSNACLILYKSLVELESQQFNPVLKLKIQKTYEELRRVSVQYVKVSSSVYEQPKNKELYRELDAMASELAKRIAAAISIAQPGGELVENKVKSDRRVVQLSSVDEKAVSTFVDSGPFTAEGTSTVSRTRNRTVAEPNQGAEILARARLATVTHDVYTELSKPAVMPAEPQPDPQRSNNVRDKVSFFTSLMDQQMRSASTAQPVYTDTSSSPGIRASNGVSAGIQRISPRNSPAEVRQTPSSSSPTLSPRTDAKRQVTQAPTSDGDLRVNRLEQENQQLKAQLKALQAENQKLRDENLKLSKSNPSGSHSISPSREKKTFF